MNGVSARTTLLELVLQASDPGDSEDLASGVGNGIKVGLDRWSVGQLLLRPMLTNLSSGLLLQVCGSLKEDDLIKPNGIVGVVEEINARSVEIIVDAREELETLEGLPVALGGSALVTLGDSGSATNDDRGEQ